jgi:hypothetical protein
MDRLGLSPVPSDDVDVIMKKSIQNVENTTRRTTVYYFCC